MVYVDPLMSHGWRMCGSTIRSCHMFTDGELQDLHELAGRIGLKRSWFQARASTPHYDLTESKRLAAVLAGAVEVTRHEAVAIWRALRTRALSSTEQSDRDPRSRPAGARAASDM